MTHDDPFIVHMNIARLKLMISAATDDTVRRTASQLLREFEAAAVMLSAPPPPVAGHGAPSQPPHCPGTPG